MKNREIALDSNKPIYCIGDIHGDWNALVEAVAKAKLRDCYLVALGDFGVGFDGFDNTKEYNGLRYISRFLISKDVELFVIRGNHDNPLYFEEESFLYFKRNPVGITKREIENISFLNDYSILHYGNKKILCVGGGVSIDRCLRTPGKNFWVGEKMRFDYYLCQECDVLLMHSGFSPFTLRGQDYKSALKDFAKLSEGIGVYLYKEIEEELSVVLKIIQKSKAKETFSGHYHVNDVIIDNGVKMNYIGISDIKEIFPFAQI